MRVTKPEARFAIGGLRQQVRRGLARFIREEDGALIPLAIQIFIVLMVVTGVSIDFVRQEELRAKMQSTLDRATLAATSLSQELDPTTVVQDYLNKAGLGYLNVTPTVEEGSQLTWRRVSATASPAMGTLFGKLIGLKTLTATASSTAEESIGNVEISMVLDISGSMSDVVDTSGNTRSTKVHQAAKIFVDKMFETVQPASAPAGRLSISVIPYNQQVYLGSVMASAFALSTEQTQTLCADVEMLPSTQISIDPNTTLQRTMYGDSFDYWGQSFSLITTSATALSSSIGNCIVNSAAAVLPWANNQTTLDNFVTALPAKGDTAIDVGMRWGLAMLDPAAQPAVTKLIGTSNVASALAGRPMAYYDGTQDLDDTAMKVILLMTDGQNTRTYSTQMAYRTGDSGFRSTTSATSFGTSGTGWSTLYYYVSSHKTGSTATPYYKMSDGKWYASSSLGSKIYTIDWATVWAAGYTLQYTIKTFLYPPRYAAYGETYQTTYGNMAVVSAASSYAGSNASKLTSYSEKDSTLLSLCSVAKNSAHGIYIFTVAVDAPDAGAAILKQCATDDSYAYDVDSASLADAFASIASSINSLRLTN